MSIFTVAMKSWGGLVAGTALLAACAGAPQMQRPAGPVIAEPQPSEPVAQPSGQTEPGPQPLVFASSGHRDMDLWRDDFAARALSMGRDREAVYATLRDIAPLDLYLGEMAKTTGTDMASQAEFAKPIWEYVTSVVTERRKSRGAEELQKLAPLFERIEAAYGVNREALTAIWAMETNLGSYIGTFDAANTLANMAVEGRRKRLGEGELLALMKLQERGDVTRAQLVSGWAGAMGQTQFMPSTFLAYAVDFDGDGKKDLWQSEADALASAANYLKASGYQKDRPWGVEVLVPSGFDWALADGQDRRLSTWLAQGLSPIGGGAFGAPDSAYAELWLPSGARGPKFLLFRNFEVFKTYNRSDAYAFSVGLLSDGVAGQDGPVALWPTDLRLLSRTEIRTLQARLNQLGFDAGPVDGIAGRGTKGALRRFQVAYQISPADGFPTRQALDQVMQAG